jgi:multiple antibiotic resistance protein
MNWDMYLNFLIAMLAIINPIGIVPMWSELTRDMKIKIRKQVAFMLVSTASIVLVVFLWGGKYLLQFFSIDLPVFKIAGGILLLLAGLSMVGGSATKLENRKEEGESIYTIAKKRYRKIMVPMAIPRLAGPGSITTVIIFGSKSSSFLDYGLMTGIIVFTMVLLLTIFSYSYWVERKVDSIILTVFTRIFGIVVAAIAVQFMLEGLGEVFPNWMEGASEIEESQKEKSR